MARTTVVWKFLMLGMLAQVTQLSLAQAQQAPSQAPQAPSQAPQQAPSQAPPQRLERIEEGSDTPITVTPPQSRQKITEKRVDGGRTTEVEVTTGKSTYTMKANPPDTVLNPNDPSTGGLRPPQWKVFEFDLFKKTQKESDATENVPPPPLAPAAK